MDPTKINCETTLAATVTSASYVFVGEKDTPAVEVRFDTELGTINGYVWLTPNAMSRSLETLNKVWGISDLPENLDGIVSSNVMIVVDKETNQNGREFVRVKWINPVSGSKTVSFADMMAKIRAVGQQPNLSDMPKITKGENDDLPF